jgi:hypothetical protein
MGKLKSRKLWVHPLGSNVVRAKTTNYQWNGARGKHIITVLFLEFRIWYVEM